MAKFRQEAGAPESVLYTVYPAQETAEHRAKFGWPPVSDADVAAVKKPRRESR